MSTDTSPVQEPVRSRDLERFITFIDAIVAIAITLLVLPLVDLATEIEPVTQSMTCSRLTRHPSVRSC